MVKPKNRTNNVNTPSADPLTWQELLDSGIKPTTCDITAGPEHRDLIRACAIPFSMQQDQQNGHPVKFAFLVDEQAVEACIMPDNYMYDRLSSDTMLIAAKIVDLKRGDQPVKLRYNFAKNTGQMHVGLA